MTIDSSVDLIVEIRTRVHEVLRAELGPIVAPIQDSDDLAQDLDCDSLDRAELTLAFEIEFGLERIPDAAMRRLRTVGDLITYFALRAPDMRCAWRPLARRA